MQQIWKTQQWPQARKRSGFIPVPKKGNAKEYSNYISIALISHASKIMLKIFQQHVDWGLPNVQVGFRKGKGTRNQIANIHWITEKERKFFLKKLIFFCFCFINYAKAFECVGNKKLWKILKEMGIAGHLTCFLRNLYAEQEPLLELDMEQRRFKIEKGVWQGCILSPWLFNFYAEYIMRNAGLDDSQAGMKIARRNINNFKCADGTTLVAESEEELKSLLMRVKEESEKAGSKLNSLKTEIMVSRPITLWPIEGKKVEAVTDVIFLDSKIVIDGDCRYEI